MNLRSLIYYVCDKFARCCTGPVPLGLNLKLWQTASTRETTGLAAKLTTRTRARAGQSTSQRRARSSGIALLLPDNTTAVFSEK